VIYLLTVSFLWAFSFGLIKGQLTGLDPVAVSAVRLGFAALVFLPALRPCALPPRQVGVLAGIGAVQFGAMYALYTLAFRFLQAHEVALFTIFTPIYVSLLDAACQRTMRWRHLLAALLAVCGTALLVNLHAGGNGVWTGFLLMQASNFCFAAGQLAYKRYHRNLPSGVEAGRVFYWLYLGGLGAATIASAGVTEWAAFRPSPGQWGVMAYLGILASGVGFFLWNLGATKVNAGTLAVFNNAKIPLGIACSLLFFGEYADLWNLAASLGILALAVAIACSGSDGGNQTATAKKNSAVSVS